MADDETPDNGDESAATAVDCYQLGLDVLCLIARSDEFPATARVAAAKALMDRGVAPGGGGEGPVEITVRFVDPTPGMELEA